MKIHSQRLNVECSGIKFYTQRVKFQYKRMKIAAKRMDNLCFRVIEKVATSPEIIYGCATFYFCLKYILLVILKTIP